MSFVNCLWWIVLLGGRIPLDELCAPELKIDCKNTYTVRCRSNAVNFLQNLHKKHPIARPLGRAMGCVLCFQILIYILPQSLECCGQYHVILDRLITAPVCIIIEMLFKISIIAVISLTNIGIMIVINAVIIIMYLYNCHYYFYHYHYHYCYDSIRYYQHEEDAGAKYNIWNISA